MGYTALYRKFRPQTFEEMVGQEHITRTLRNQIMANRVGHAYLFNGVEEQENDFCKSFSTCNKLLESEGWRAM